MRLALDSHNIRINKSHAEICCFRVSCIWYRVVNIECTHSLSICTFYMHQDELQIPSLVLDALITDYRSVVDSTVESTDQSVPCMRTHSHRPSQHVCMSSAKHWVYSATSIIRTSYIRNLDYPDQPETRKYITTHAQKAWPMIFCGCGHRLSNELQTLQTCFPKLTDQNYFLSTAGHDHAVQVSSIRQVS